MQHFSHVFIPLESRLEEDSSWFIYHILQWINATHLLLMSLCSTASIETSTTPIAHPQLPVKFTFENPFAITPTYHHLMAKLHRENSCCMQTKNNYAASKHKLQDSFNNFQLCLLALFTVICLWKFQLPKIKNEKKVPSVFCANNCLAERRKQSRRSETEKPKQKQKDERHEIFLLVGTVWPESCPKEFDAINAI